MKHKLKFGFLISFLLLVSGCDGTYQMTINGDLSVKESMSMTESRSVIETYTANFNQYGDTMINDLKEAYPNYSMNSQTNTNSLDGSGFKTFQTLDMYASDSVLKKIALKTVNIREENNIITIQLKDFDKGNSLLTGDEIYNATFNNLTLEIKSAYQVQSSNAEEVDKTNNVYRWKFSQDKLPTEINLVIDKNKTFNPPLLSNSAFLTTVIVGGISIVILVLGVIVFNRVKESNKI